MKEVCGGFTSLWINFLIGGTLLLESRVYTDPVESRVQHHEKPAGLQNSYILQPIGLMSSMADYSMAILTSKILWVNELTENIEKGSHVRLLCLKGEIHIWSVLLFPLSFQLKTPLVDNLLYFTPSLLFPKYYCAQSKWTSSWSLVVVIKQLYLLC